MVHSATRADLSRLPWTSYVDLVRTRAESQPERVILTGLPRWTEPGRPYTWAALDRRVRALAATLQAAGAAGQRVLILLENDPDYLMSFLACAYAGAVAVPMPPLAHARHALRLSRVIEDCGATFALSDAPLLARMRSEAGLSSALDRIQGIAVEAVPDSRCADWDDHYPQAEEVAFLQYTSGSTSAPKGVVVRHGDLIFQGEALEHSFSLRATDRALCWIPLFHDLGLVLGALQALYTGYPLLLARPTAFVKAPGEWLAALSRHKVTFTLAPNFAYDLCVDDVDPSSIPGLDLSGLAMSLNAAEPVRAATIDRFQAKFGPYGFRAEVMQPGYGLAEATLAVSSTPRGRAHRRLNLDPSALSLGRVQASEGPGARAIVSAGQPLGGVSVKIRDTETGLALPPRRVGEICSTAAWFPETYWGRPDADVFGARFEGDPRRFLRTGDLGFVDTDGELFITGRDKDVIIVAGKNHYPQDIELSVEDAHPAIRRNFVAAFGVDQGEREGVVVVAELRSPLSAPERVALCRHIGRTLGERHELPIVDIRLVRAGQVPKTTSGKVQRRLCRERWSGGALEAAE